MNNLADKVSELIKSQNTEDLVKVLEEAKNKKFVVDMALLPKQFSLDEWMYYFETLNICFINTFKTKDNEEQSNSRST